MKINHTPMFETKKLRAKILEQDQERAKGVMSALSRNSILLSLEQAHIREETIHERIATNDIIKTRNKNR